MRQDLKPEALKNGIWQSLRNIIEYNNNRLNEFLTPKEVVIYGLSKNIDNPLTIKTSTVCQGRGVFATEDIPSNTYLCEYRGDVIFDKQILREREEEYKKDDEGCFIFETTTSDGTFIAIDATRKMTSIAR